MSLSHETEFNFPDSYFRSFRWINPFLALFSLPFSGARLDIREPNSGMDQGSKHLQVIKHDLSFKPESITSKS